MEVTAEVTVYGDVMCPFCGAWHRAEITDTVVVEMDTPEGEED